MEFAYPEVKRGTLVEWALEPTTPDPEWMFGVVTKIKTLSCDIFLFGLGINGARDNCIHADDPRCTTKRLHKDESRGVFRLSSVELKNRAKDKVIDEELPSIRRDIAQLKTLVQDSSLETDGRRRKTVPV